MIQNINAKWKQRKSDRNPTIRDNLFQSVLLGTDDSVGLKPFILLTELLLHISYVSDIRFVATDVLLLRTMLIW